MVLRGDEAAGDRVILDLAESFDKSSKTEPYVMTHALFIDYAGMCNNLGKAGPSADIVLESKPDYVPALAVRMVKLRSAGDTEGARKIAQRILELDEKPKSPWRKLAEED